MLGCVSSFRSEISRIAVLGTPSESLHTHTHSETVVITQQASYSSSVRPTITPGGTPGQVTPSQPTGDTSGATWNGLGRWAPPPDPEWERERATQRLIVLVIATTMFLWHCHQGTATARSIYIFKKYGHIFNICCSSRRRCLKCIKCTGR